MEEKTKLVFKFFLVTYLKVGVMERTERRGDTGREEETQGERSSILLVQLATKARVGATLKPGSRRFIPVFQVSAGAQAVFHCIPRYISGELDQK